MQLPLDTLTHLRIILVLASIAIKEGAAAVDAFCASALAFASSAQSPVSESDLPLSQGDTLARGLHEDRYESGLKP